MMMISALILKQNRAADSLTFTGTGFTDFSYRP
jgi:hypothetical protein